MKRFSMKVTAFLICILMVLSVMPQVFAATPKYASSNASKSGSAGDGNVLNIIKTVSESADGYEYQIEAYAEGTDWGDTVNSRALDVVVLMDVSDKALERTAGTDTYTPLSKTNYSYETFVDGYYFYFDGTGYQSVTRHTYDTEGIKGFCALTYSIGGTTYYIQNNGTASTTPSYANNTVDTICSSVFYIRDNSRISVMKKAVCNLVDTINSDTDLNETSHRITVIKYAGTETETNMGNKINGALNPCYNYTQILYGPSLCDDTHIDSIKDAVNSVVPCGTSSLVTGLEMAKKVCEEDLSLSTKKKIVIVLTDSYNAGEENEAVLKAKELKDLGVSVYTYGHEQVSDNDKFKLELSCVSSDYPKALSTTDKGTAAGTSAQYSKVIKYSEDLGDILKTVASKEFTLAASEKQESYITDTLSKYFKFREGSIKVYSSKKNSKAGWNDPVLITDTDVSVTVDSKGVLKVDGYDLAENSTYADGSSWKGSKLVIKAILDPTDEKILADTRKVNVSEKAFLSVRSKQVTMTESPKMPTYTVTYKYAGDVPADEEVPVNSWSYLMGQKYEVAQKTVPASYRYDDYGNRTAVHEFLGWDTESGIMENKNVSITGTWKFTEIPRGIYFVRYSWSGDIPDGVNTPTDITTYFNNMPFTVNGEYTSATNITVVHSKYLSSVYSFSGWKLAGNVIESGVIDYNDANLTGVWTKKDIETKYTKVSYEWNEVKKPALATLPAEDEYKYNTEFTVDDSFKEGLYREIKDAYENIIARYSFSGWKIDGNVVTGKVENGENTEIKLKGIWTKEEFTLPKYSVSYKWKNSVYPVDTALPTDTNLYVHNQPYTVDTTLKVGDTVNGKNEKGIVTGVYTFDGWDTQDGVITDHDMVITGSWTYKEVPATEYTVTFKAGTNGKIDGKTKNITEKLPGGSDFPDEPDTDANSGYEFYAWEDEYGRLYDEGKLPSEVCTDITLTAIFIKKNSDYNQLAAYKVEHYLENSKGEYELEKTEYPLYGELGKKVTAEEYDFDGYTYNSKKSTSSGKTFVTGKYEDGKAPEILVLKMYYDEGGYTVKFSCGENGTVNGATKDITNKDLEYGDKFPTEPTVKADSGYEFYAWEDEYGRLYEEDKLPSKVYGSITLTAVFVKKGEDYDERVAYKVEYYLEKSDGEYELKKTVFPLYAKEGKKVYAEELEFDGYTYNSNKSVESGKTFIDGEYKDGEAPEILVLKMYYDEGGCTVKFVPGENGKIGGSTKTISYSVESGDDFPTEPTVKANSGYEFYAWEDEYGRIYDEDELPKKVNGSITLTAVFTEKGDDYDERVAYKVEYYLENSKGKYELKKTVFPLYAKEGKKVTADILEFVGYEYNSSKSESSGKTYIDGEYEDDEETEILVLKMYYDVTDYTVKFVVNKNGTLNGNTTDITYSLNSGDKFPTAPTAKANTGYEFSYWKDSNGNKVTSFPTTVTKSETYTAVWVSEEEKVNPNTGAEGTYVIGIMIAAAAMAVITGKKKK